MILRVGIVIVYYYYLVKLAWCGTLVPQPLPIYVCRSKVICVDMPMGLARCGTPVPQPLSVMNNVKAKGGKRLVVGERMSEVKSNRGFCVVVSDNHGF